MKITQQGIDIIKESEKYSMTPYLCPAGIPTIGYGTTYYPNGSKVSMHEQPISKDKANELLMDTVNSFSKQIIAHVKKPLNDNQFSAIISIAYNIGVGAFEESTLLKKINENPNDETIFDEFLKWNKGGGKVLQGLVIRRNKEARLYFQK